MPDRKSWEASIGRVYLTRGGKRTRVVKVSEERVWVELLESETSSLFAVGLDGLRTNPPLSQWDLMEMDRTTNMDGAK